MNTVKVTINEFGPIRNQEVTLSPLMIFTGNSNVGKSYINYLMYYFFSAFTEERMNTLVKTKIKDGNDGVFSFTLTIDEIRYWINENAQDFMRDFLGDSNLKCDVNFDFRIESVDKLEVIAKKEEAPEGLSSPFGNLSIITTVINGSEVYKNFNLDEIFPIVKSLQRYFAKHLFHTSIIKSVILPPARGAYVGETYSTKNNIAAATGMFRLFLRDYDLAVSSAFPMEDETDTQFFESQIQKLVNGKLISEKGNQYLKLANGQVIPMTAAASSIKELSPLLFYIMNWSDLGLSICLEEPEAHLHPDMQVNVANLLAAVRNKGSFIQLTTHSDYFLQRINQLIKLGDIKQKDEETFKKICYEKKLNKRFYLNKEDVKAYYFEIGEDGMTLIKDLTIDKNGIPFATFFNTVQRLSEDEDYLNEMMDNDDTCIE